MPSTCIVSGSARVIKRGEHGEEIALNVLHRGDSFGESGLLEGASRLATVRASGPVTVLRLRRTVFAGLARAHPEVADAFKAVARERSLWNLLPIHSSFASLPAAALGELLTGLERVDVAAGEIVVFEGEPPGPMYIVDEGRLRAYRSEHGRQHDLQFFRKGDFFGERSLFLGEPRAATRRGRRRLLAAAAAGLAVPEAAATSTPSSESGSRSVSDSTTTAAWHACRSTSPTRSCPQKHRSLRATPRTSRRPSAPKRLSSSTTAATPASPRRRRRFPARLPARRDGLRRRLPGDGLPLLRP